LPGIGKVLGDRLVSKGYEKAYLLLGQFLVFRGQEETFCMWLKELCNANSKQRTDCYNCLKEWSNAFVF